MTDPPDQADVVVFGAGYTGSRVCELAVRRGSQVVAVVRSENSARSLTGRGFAISSQPAPVVARAVVGSKTHAIISFPPDEATDVPLAAELAAARAVSYLSTTGVYQDIEGVVNDATELPPNPTPKYRRVLDAEATYRAIGAAVLRSPGIYGPERGIHVRLRRGDFRLSGDGSGFSSRIHVEDLAELLLASDQTRGETFVVGDLDPARQREVVAWLCQEYGLPFPASAPLEVVHETLRRSRQVDASRALRVLGVTLKYPSYRIGFR